MPTFEETDNLCIENGKALPISVEIRDRAGNFSMHPKLVVQCKVRDFNGKFLSIIIKYGDKVFLNTYLHKFVTGRWLSHQISSQLT